MNLKRPPQMSKLEPVTFRLPAKLLTRLRVKSATSKLTMQRIVAEAIADYLRAAKKDQ